jgi:hypothetical protein
VQATIRHLGFAVLTVALALAETPLSAQITVEGTEWSITPLRRSGQPVVPIFDGWYPNSDGTYQLCFGYYNLNTEQVLDVPLGPQNYIEPQEFNGGQPTHFMLSSVPDGYMRHWCVFSVTVPAEYAGEWDRPRMLEKGEPRVVWWTLHSNGQELSVPGHLMSINYLLDELDVPARVLGVAPIVRFEPDGPDGRGRNGFVSRPLRTAVGQALELSVSLRPPEGSSRDEWHVGWGLHQGPGEVTFERNLIDLVDGETLASTTARFSQPGSYVLRVQGVSSTDTFEFHCCWTNGYIHVTVER